MPAGAEAASAAGPWELFLSSTVTDFEEFRREVQEALLRKAEAACFLSEDWVGGFDDTVAKCRARVQQARGFFLLLGHWYGSTPPGSARSITHLEFGWAVERWGALPFPPVAVMMPRAASPADVRLREAARRILDERIDPGQHAESLAAFHAEAVGSWRTVVPFTDEHDLRENAIVTCFRWQGRTPEAAARGQVAVAGPGPGDSQVTDELLGTLGRKPQLDAVRAAVAELADRAEVPALAMIVHGDEDAGHRAFLLHLTSTVLKGYIRGAASAACRPATTTRRCCPPGWPRPSVWAAVRPCRPPSSWPSAWLPSSAGSPCSSCWTAWQMWRVAWRPSGTPSGRRSSGTCPGCGQRPGTG
jgi:hypothetical protein